jgi:hypothetical protein
MGRMLDNNSTNINKTNNHLSPQTVEHTCPFLVLKIKNKFPLEPIATSNFGHRILETIDPAA